MSQKNLILLHGALGSSKSFDALFPLLSDDFNLIVPDLKGHGGRANPSTSFRMNDLVEDFENLLQNEHMQATAVFGYSMGGYVALSLALRKPEFFTKIMTLGTKLDWKPEQATIETKMLNPDKIQQKVPKFAHHLEALHGDKWMNLCRQTADMMLDLGTNPILMTQNISGINFPVRLGLGDQDHMVSLEETATFYRALTVGELQVFPNCPHPIERIDVKMIANAIKDFLKD